MRAIIVGCGRTGAGIAEALVGSGHEVTIIDVSSTAFRRLRPDFAGSAIRGDGTDGDVLKRAGAEGADLFFAMTEGDNRNVLAAQLARDVFAVKRAVAKINDPVRAEAYTALGLNCICRTAMMVDALKRFLGMEGDPHAQTVWETTGERGQAKVTEAS